ncbi:PH domain-containing protein [Mucilaginibacter lappiensis]|uniref:PH domain-containing protein n=1 Tax=Mucilaginibacter lappiensis TaxID=354630 RepID=UPI003D1D43C8
MQNPEIELRPAMIFAFVKSLPLILLGGAFLLLAWRLSPFFLFFSIAAIGAAWYRFMYIRNSLYIITPEVIRISRGIFFKRIDQVEMYRVKDYIVTQPLLLQLFSLMNVTLKSTDPENPILWLAGIPRSDLIDTIRGHVQEARKDNRIYEIN